MNMISSIIILFMCFNGNYRDCKIFLNRNDRYHYTEDGLKSYIEENNLIEIKGIKKEKLIKYAQTINNLIINNKIELLIKNFSTKEFYYYGSEEVTDNILKQIKNELLSRKGYYYNFIFNSSKKYKDSEILAIPEARYIDIRKYLICYKSKLKWWVIYTPKKNIYEIFFSIPDWIVQEFDNFHYVVKEENGKYILIGF